MNRPLSGSSRPTATSRGSTGSRRRAARLRSARYERHHDSIWLGVTVLVRSILSDKMRELGTQDGFPELPDSVITLLRGSTSAAPAIACLSDFIQAHFKQFQTRVA